MTGAQDTSRIPSPAGAHGMTCTEARLLLATSRRDEWTPAELSAISEHLGTCAACRQKQEAYRGVGEHIRELPTIVPPASFRAQVFAAVEADRARHESPAARLAQADTDPELPVVRVLPRTHRSGQATSTRRGPQPARIAAGLAAALVIGVLGAQAVGDFNPGVLSNAFSHLNPGSATSPTVASYALGGQYSSVQQAMAGKQWVVAVASAGATGEMLVALDRATGKITPMLDGPVDGPLRIVAMTDSVVVWVQGDPLDAHEGLDGWHLNVTRLPSGDGVFPGAPSGLASGMPFDLPGQSGAYNILTGVSVTGNTVVATLASNEPSGARSIVESCMVSPAGPVGATGSAISQFFKADAGHLVSDPVLVGSTYYWTDAWVDGSGQLHSALVRWTGPQATTVVVPDGVFGLRAAGNTLVYITASNVQAPSSGELPALAQTVAGVSGTLTVRDLASGHTSQVARGVSGASLASSGSVLIYRAADGLHAYDARTSTPLAVDSSLRSAGYVLTSPQSLAWGQSGAHPIQVYNLP